MHIEDITDCWIIIEEPNVDKHITKIIYFLCRRTFDILNTIVIFKPPYGRTHTSEEKAEYTKKFILTEEQENKIKEYANIRVSSIPS